ncbi:unnamed protein product [Citrullus colocynthis]|uniref:Uncharacterized protein n=1 Tax=Citrullus colocynthis TaxID=252529 RepID=A0ABP0Z3X3_9ROSI
MLLRKIYQLMKPRLLLEETIDFNRSITCIDCSKNVISSVFPIFQTATLVYLFSLTTVKHHHESQQLKFHLPAIISFLPTNIMKLLVWTVQVENRQHHHKPASRY